MESMPEKAERTFLASDVSAVVAHTRDVVYLNDYDIVTITKDSYDVQSHQGVPAEVKVSRVEFSADDAEKGEFPHVSASVLLLSGHSSYHHSAGR